MDGRKAGTSFIVSELYAARFQPLGPCRVCGQNVPPSSPTRVYCCALVPTLVARKQSGSSVHVTLRIPLDMMYFFYSFFFSFFIFLFALLLEIISLAPVFRGRRNNSGRKGGEKEESQSFEGKMYNNFFEIWTFENGNFVKFFVKFLYIWKFRKLGKRKVKESWN